MTARSERWPRQQSPTADDKALQAALRERLNDLRGLLRQNVTEAQPVLEALLARRIVVTPHRDTSTKAPVFDVRVTLSTRAIFEGICVPKGGTSPEGFEPSLPA